MLDPHRWLLSDRGRTEAYRSAIRQLVRPGDVVVDAGSGTGILAFFAAEAGAARVYAIERQHTADVAALLARHNGLEGKVIVLHERSLDATLPERARVLVTETLGNFGLDEQILSLIIDARRRYLTPDPVLIPRRVVLYAVPVEMPEAFARHVGWWSEPRFGVDLHPVRALASNTPYPADVPERAHLAAPAAIMDIDLATVETSDAAGQARFTAEKDGVLHGFGGSFASTIAPGIELSNPLPHDTHWQQVFLPIEHPIEVTRGDPIELELTTEDGREWHWRGRAGSQEFDQSTRRCVPPCTLPGRRD